MREVVSEMFGKIGFAQKNFVATSGATEFRLFCWSALLIFWRVFSCISL